MGTGDPEKLPPDELIKTLRKELARIYGPEYAEKCEIHYESNIYYFRSLTQGKDGNLHLSGPRQALRRSQVQWMIDQLRARKPPRKRFIWF